MRLRYTSGQVLFLVCVCLISAEDIRLRPEAFDSSKGGQSAKISVDASGLESGRDSLNKRDLGSLAEGDSGEANRRRLNSDVVGIDSVAGESSDGSVHKRNLGDWPGCRDGFEVHKDKIIRTQDSKALGARYLNERDVASREDCMHLCCSSDNCDVFVFEENKVPGGCYLFECGPPEDFKCKFTKYHNYTSGFLNVNRHITDLEQIKYTQHERELTNLREPHKSPEQLSIHKTTVSPKSKEVPEQYGSELLHSPPAVGSKKGCSRNQFECHSSGECIAIYNACDGIPQCADGSDESPELGCPAQPPIAATISVPMRHVHPTPQPLVRQPQQLQAEYIPEVAGSGEAGSSDKDINIPPVRKQWPPHEEYNLKTQQVASSPYQQKLPSLSGSQLSGLNLQEVQRSGYGREGEELLNYRGPDPASTWTSNQYRHNQGTSGSQIFTHKGEGLVPQNNRFQPPQHATYVAPETQIRSGLQYNDPGQTDYAKYYSMENGNYNRMYGNGQGAAPNSWQTIPKPHNLNIPESGGLQNMDEIPMSRTDVQQSGPYPDYYYDEMYKNKIQQQRLQQQQQVPQYPAAPPATYQQRNDPPVQIPPAHPKEVPHNEPVKTPQPAQTANPAVQPTTTILPQKKDAEGKSKDESVSDSSHEAHSGKSSHRKVDKLTADVRVKESTLNLEEELHVNTPRGAVLSLTMGLCVTGIMLILVGCRMRMVTKRMRRGGKGYAHDADFLVNGMYL